MKIHHQKSCLAVINQMVTILSKVQWKHEINVLFYVNNFGPGDKMLLNEKF